MEGSSTEWRNQQQGVDGPMGLLGLLEIRRLIVQRFNYYLISKKGMEVLQAMRSLEAREREAGGGSEDSAQG